MKFTIAFVITQIDLEVDSFGRSTAKASGHAASGNSSCNFTIPMQFDVAKQLAQSVCKKPIGMTATVDFPHPHGC